MDEIKMPRVFSGTSGLVTPVPQAQYPPAFQGKSRLEYYASLYNSIEINSSFYKMPNGATIKKWALSVPDNFTFTFKLLKTITHQKELVFEPAEIKTFIEMIGQVEEKKGCLLIQFPPSLHRDHIDQLDNLLFEIQNADPNVLWKPAVEFRNPSWYHEDTYRLLDEFNAAMVIHDIPASLPPIKMMNAGHMYVRFHGPGGKYRGSYDDVVLREYAGYIQEWQQAGKDVFCYFNNTMGEALKNLDSMKVLVEQLK